MKKFSEDEAERFTESCRTFKKYNSIEDYIEDVVACLVYSSWHYTEEQARECIKDRMDYVKEAFLNEEPADACCAEVGFYAG